MRRESKSPTLPIATAGTQLPPAYGGKPEDGRAHFDVVIVSERFGGLATLKRHRLVYDALDSLMKTDIHALSIKALTPEQAAQD